MHVDPIAEPLSFYGSPSGCPAVEWSWVDRQLGDAGTYWIVPRSDDAPHPRPVWGVWDHRSLLLSIGSQVIARELRAEQLATVHLDSGTDVVIVEGHVDGQCAEVEALAAYDAKYDWNYTVDEYGPLTVLRPTLVMAWRSGGFAGRDGFQAASRFRFGVPTTG